MKFILGEKQNMTQVWRNDKLVAVTAVKVENCVVSAIKSKSRDGYSAVCLGLGKRKEKNIKKPQLVRFKKLNIFPRYQKEFRIEEIGEDVKEGSQVSLNTFSVGDKVCVTGISKGKGFQGVVKRHGFAGQKATHGNKDQLRMPGSIGSAGAGHVFKGVRMPGRMGCDRVSVSNLEIIEVDEEKNILYIKGAIAGYYSSLVMIKSKEGELVIKKKEEKKVEEKTVKEEAVKESVEVKEESKEESKVKDEVKKEAKIKEENSNEKKQS